MRGGKREGAGRKLGSATKRTREIADRAASAGLMPLEYMLQVVRDPSVEYDRRDRMATAAAPYCHSRLNATEHTGKGGEPIKVIIESGDAGLL